MPIWIDSVLDRRSKSQSTWLEFWTVNWGGREWGKRDLGLEIEKGAWSMVNLNCDLREFDVFLFFLFFFSNFFGHFVTKPILLSQLNIRNLSHKHQFRLVQAYFQSWHRLKLEKHQANNQKLIKIRITKNQSFISKEKMRHNKSVT